MATQKDKLEIGKKIADDLVRYLAVIQESLDNRVAGKIGDVIVKAMLEMVSKGVSPIEGHGRFPAYKAVEFKRALQREKSAVNKALRANKKALFRFRRMNQRQLLVAQKEANRKALGGVNRGGYPYSVQDRYPGKKPRPVNLFLSGEFLDALQAHISGVAGEVGIEIGFFPGWTDREGVEAATKEQGHRERAGGQGFRPIIPIGTEEFAVTIQNAVWEIIEEEIDKAAAQEAR